MRAIRAYTGGFFVLLCALALSTCRAALIPSLPEGAAALASIVSSCTGDVSGDGMTVLLAITGDGEIPGGERYGQRLLVCDETAGLFLAELGYIPSDKIIYSIDLAEIKPMKVQLGDINGDGVNEIALCVYKTAKFHDEMAKRPFFFDLTEGNLIPVWLGSRLSRPFDDFILCDLNGDGFDEIAAVEQLENGERAVAVYGWKGFGFEVLAESEPFPCTLIIARSGDRQDSFNVMRSDTMEHYEYIFNDGGLNHVS